VWIVLLTSVAGAIGAYLDLSGRSSFPIWVWIPLLFIGLIIMPFIAFHRVREQRDEARNIKEYYITPSFVKVSYSDYSFEVKDDSIRLRFNLQIHAVPPIRIEEIQMEIRGKRYDTDWEPMAEAITDVSGRDVYINLPKSFPSNTYPARLVVCTERRGFFSDSFDLAFSMDKVDNFW